MKINKIYFGDCIELIKKIDNESVDLIITSPPYVDTVSYGKHVKVFNQNEYINWLIDLFKDSERILKNTGSFILNINDRIINGERSIYVFDLVCRIINQTSLKLYDRYIWFKKSALPMTGDKRLNDRIEYIFHFVKNVKKFKCYTDRIREPYENVSLKRFKNKVHGNDIINDDGTTQLSQRGSSTPHLLGKKPISVFRFDTGSALRGIKHPAPYNPQLTDFFIKWLTDKEDIVLDPFIGSGTTAISCVRINRKYIGFEINKEYIKEAEKRLNDEIIPINKKWFE